MNYTIRIEGKWAARVTVSKGRGDLKRGTESSIRDQFLLPRKQYEDLVACPFSKEDYVGYLKREGKI